MTVAAGIGEFLCVEQQVRFFVNGGSIKPALRQRKHLKCRQIKIIFLCFQTIQGATGEHAKKEANEYAAIKTIHWHYLPCFYPPDDYHLRKAINLIIIIKNYQSSVTIIFIFNIIRFKVAESRSLQEGQ